MGAIYKSKQLSATAIAPNLPTDVFGRARLEYIEFTTVAGIVATDVIELAKLPLGARIHHIVVLVPQLDASSNGATTPTTLELGDKDVANRYAAAQGPNTGGLGIAYGAGGTFSQVPILVDTEGKRTIQLTVTASDIPAGVVIQGRVLYVVD